MPLIALNHYHDGELSPVVKSYHVPSGLRFSLEFPDVQICGLSLANCRRFRDAFAAAIADAEQQPEVVAQAAEQDAIEASPRSTDNF